MPSNSWVIRTSMTGSDDARKGHQPLGMSLEHRGDLLGSCFAARAGGEEDRCQTQVKIARPRRTMATAEQRESEHRTREPLVPNRSAPPRAHYRAGADQLAPVGSACQRSSDLDGPDARRVSPGANAHRSPGGVSPQATAAAPARSRFRRRLLRSGWHRNPRTACALCRPHRALASGLHPGVEPDQSTSRPPLIHRRHDPAQPLRQRPHLTWPERRSASIAPR